MEHTLERICVQKGNSASTANHKDITSILKRNLEIQVSF